ncbi:hypothetical protein [Mycobacterium kyogaense]|uniref:hypothetical protein n=1 Tax=Mycobacterium kyogaense TaxID=2212479 RepID=UPI000DACDC87|nr:hypothetical protein [Mycobacterium kyogaense]
MTDNESDNAQAEPDGQPRYNAPIQRLMRGEAADTQRSAYEAAVNAVGALISILERAVQVQFKEPVKPNAARIWWNVAFRFTQLQDLLHELIVIVAPRGSASQREVSIEFGLLIDAEQLQALANLVNGASATLREYNPATAYSADQAIDSLDIVLTKWDNEVIPQALDDLAEAQRRRSWTIRPGEYVDELLSERRNQRLATQDQVADDLVERLVNLGNRGGSEGLAQTFSDRADKEEDAAFTWTSLAVIFVILGIALPVIVLSLEDQILVQLTDTTGTIVKALIGVPLFVLAAYAARVASECRRMAGHMRTLVNQIDAVNLFVAPLPKPVQEEIIAALGRRAFSEPGITTSKDASDIPAPVLLDKLLEVVKELRKP